MIRHVAHMHHRAPAQGLAMVHRWHVLSLHIGHGAYELGGESCRLRGAGLILLPAGDRDLNRLDAGDRAWWCQFSGQAVSSDGQWALLSFAGKRSLGSRLRQLEAAEATRAGVWFRELHAAWRQGTSSAALQVRARMLDLLALWAAPRASPDADRSELLRALLERYACDAVLSVPAMTRRIGGDPDRLSRLFHQRFGVTPVAYRTRQRVLRACALLVHDPQPLSAIATACGFSDAGYLCRVFRRQLGVSPRAYARGFGGPTAG